MPPTLPQPNTITPTLILGLGGTGREALLRIQRLVKELYGSLDRLPTLGLLYLDTDRDETLPTVFQPKEQQSIGVPFERAYHIARSPEAYPAFHQWLPPELIARPGLLVSESGTRQLRASGRFAFFANYAAIGQHCKSIRRSLQGHEAFIFEQYGLTIAPQFNIIVIASSAGGTGSGMLIDIGYALRQWFQAEPAVETTGIVLYPDALSGMNVNLRAKENAYAALMELNYFSDTNTIYRVVHHAREHTVISDPRPPYDFTYLVGTSNGQGMDLKLDTIYDMIAQSVTLEFVPGYSTYKRTIRHRIHQQVGQQVDLLPQGRRYPRSFMSFGIATIEIPLHQIRQTLSARLAADLYKWWRNAELSLPPNLRQEAELWLKQMQICGKELRSTLLLSPYNRPCQQIVQLWIKELAERVMAQDRLQCTAQLPNLPPFAREVGNILNFVEDFLVPRVDRFRQDYLREDTPDPEQHGYLLRQMYENRDQLIQRATSALQDKLYADLIHRQRGPHYLQALLRQVERLLQAEIDRSQQEISVWEAIEASGLQEFRQACVRMSQVSTQWMAHKQTWMQQQSDLAIAAQGKALQALLERRAHLVAIDVLRQLDRVVHQLRWQLDHWLKRVSHSETLCWQIATHLANIDVLELDGLKLFQRQELDRLYTDFVTVQGGLDCLCHQLTDQILGCAQNRAVGQSTKPVFRLLDLQKITDVEYAEFEAIVNQTTQSWLEQSPAQTKRPTKLHLEQDACTRFMKLFPEPQNQQSQITLLFNCSKPLVYLDRQAPLGRFDYVQIAQAAVVGGIYNQEPAVQEQIKLLQKYFKGEDAIVPLPEQERHKIYAVHEVGGFSLRCLAGIETLRKSYQAWQSKRMVAERKRLQGEKADYPLPVHIQNDLIFPDIVPSDSTIEKLAVIAQALGILSEMTHPKAKAPVIVYRKTDTMTDVTTDAMVNSTTNNMGNILKVESQIEAKIEPQIVVIANRWDEVMQVLELPDFQSDRQVIHQQIGEQLRQINLHDNKEDMLMRLKSYLDKLLLSDPQGLEPLHLRRRRIIEKFIKVNQLQPQ